MVAREAMGFARRVVATDVGGLRDAVVNGVTGLLVPPGDPVALRSGIERVLGDPRMRARLGLAAREAAAKSFSWSGYVEAVEGVYADALR
jgi:glycosyltransferase involved in cell wall biosynthesis